MVEPPVVKAPAPKPPAPEETPAAAPVAKAPVAPPAPAKPAPAPPAEESGPMRRGFSPLGGRGGKIKVMPNKNKAEKKEKGAGDPRKDQPKKPDQPAIRLASMPEVKQPAPKAAEPEVKAQKPDIRLPKDAINKAKRGTPAPLEQYTDQQKKGKTARPETTPAAGESGAAAPLDRSRKRRGAKGETLDPDEKRIMAKTRPDRKGRRGRGGLDDDERGRPSYNRRKGRKVKPPADRKKAIVLQLPCTVREFSEAAGISSGEVLKFLMSEGIAITINGKIEDQMVELLVAHFDVKVEVRQHETLEDSHISVLDDREDSPEDMVMRPPVVTFLGHVDHGKTSLLDALIGINVVSGEAGGITQHIRAYEVEKNGRMIAFVDTPGHEAFTEMRARGANVTDIAVLVVAAEDGVMPQTEEAISHARAAGVPIVVALNKIDLPGADANRVMQQLAQFNLLPSEWGGETEVVKTSALSGEGLDELLETLLLVADLNEWKANPNRPALGVCLESEQDPARGVTAKMIVQKGTLKVGDVIVCGSAHGRVKAMYNTLHKNKRLTEAGPSTPINLIGLDVAPEAGESFHVLEDIGVARELAEKREFDRKSGQLSGHSTEVTYDRFLALLEDGKLGKPNEVITLNLILRADTRGSIEAIQKEFTKFTHPEVQVRILQASVGGVSVADVTLAHASQAVIVAFNVIPDEAARAMADDRGVEVRRYEVIYKVTDDIKLMLEGRLKPEEQVVELGMAGVMQTFDISRVGTIAGCRVMRGTIERNARARVYRENRMIGDYPIDALKREKDDAKEVRQGFECGIKLAGFNDVKVGDMLEAYKIQEVARTLDS
ncbi:translation initiation factor IF-2 [Lignipirellula cremea]|uniref:translation initiation factor IF-2 n=1 Tax=Lignipirellula cremea TaxID=2528010 RepID=UPI0028F3E4D6|nr:translation initiation factor IF-2 [Lignipirellula cremea]